MELIFKGSEILNFFKICTFLNNGATQVWNVAQQVPYAYHGNEWVGYDNIKSFHIKVRPVVLMCWALTLSPWKQSDSCCPFSLTRLSGLRITVLEVPWSGLLIWMTSLALSVVRANSPWPPPWRKPSKCTVQVSGSETMMRVAKCSFINSKEALACLCSPPVLFLSFPPTTNHYASHFIFYKKSGLLRICLFLG